MNNGSRDFCILDEKDTSMRDNILQYSKLLIVTEHNSQTAKREHAAVLKEIESGRTYWHH